MRTPDWQSRARCRDTDVDLFFPEGKSGIHAEQAEAAVAICRSCEVASECLAYALRTGQSHGIWGGKTEDERKVLGRRLVSV